MKHSCAPRSGNSGLDDQGVGAEHTPKAAQLRGPICSSPSARVQRPGPHIQPRCGGRPSTSAPNEHAPSGPPRRLPSGTVADAKGDGATRARRRMRCRLSAQHVRTCSDRHDPRHDIVRRRGGRGVGAATAPAASRIRSPPRPPRPLHPQARTSLLSTKASRDSSPSNVHSLAAARRDRGGSHLPTPPLPPGARRRHSRNRTSSGLAGGASPSPPLGLAAPLARDRASHRAPARAQGGPRTRCAVRCAQCAAAPAPREPRPRRSAPACCSGSSAPGAGPCLSHALPRREPSPRSPSLAPHVARGT